MTNVRIFHIRSRCIIIKEGIKASRLLIDLTTAGKTGPQEVNPSSLECTKRPNLLMTGVHTLVFACGVIA